MSEWYPNADELIAYLQRICAPLESQRENYYETLLALRSWCELGDKALKMEIDDRMRMKFYFCKRVWKIRTHKAPNDEETWAQCFERMFHQSIEDYARIAKEENHRKKVLEYELARFGKSPLEQDKAVAA